MLSTEKAKSPTNVRSKVKTKVETTGASVGSVEMHQQLSDFTKKEEEVTSISSVSVICGDNMNLIWFHCYPHSLIYKHQPHKINLTHD
jgi:hypothetical protein